MFKGIRLVSWTLVYTKRARKDAKKIASSDLKPKAKKLLNTLKKDPFQKPPPFEALVGDLNGAFSRRINIQHLLVYEVIEEEKTVKILSMWTHYE
jgi:Txe/YoeB family toxin of toxin-antitoxin system